MLAARASAEPEVADFPAPVTCNDVLELPGARRYLRMSSDGIV